MKKDAAPVEPEVTPEARLVCFLSEEGLRDALRQGVQTTREVIHSLGPDDECWDEFFGLEPVLFYRLPAKGEVDPGVAPAVAAEIVVGQPFRYSVVPLEPQRWSYPELEELLPDMAVWRRPSIELEHGPREEAEELNQYLSISQLLEHERTLRDNVGGAKVAKELNTANLAWRSWIRATGAKHVADVARVTSELIESTNLPDEQRDDLEERTSDFLRLVKEVNLYSADDSILAKFMEKLPSVYDAVSDAWKVGATEAARNAELVEAERWVRENGSQRLRKALETDLLRSAMGAYRDERLAQERPRGGWRWLPADLELKAIVNPSERALDALLAVRNQYPRSDSSLHYDPATRTPMIVSTFLDRTICAPASSVLEASHEEPGPGASPVGRRPNDRSYQGLGLAPMEPKS